MGDFVHRRTDGRDRGRSYSEVPIAFGRHVLRLACAELGRTRDECRAESRRLGKREIAIAGRRVQGIVPAPEPNHAIRAVIDEAIRAREAGESKVIPSNLCGHGRHAGHGSEDQDRGTGAILGARSHSRPRTTTNAHVTRAPVLGMKADPPHRSERLIETYGSDVQLVANRGSNKTLQNADY